MWHALKTWPTQFQAVVDGVKRFEFRRDDRGFAVGDFLWLREFDPKAERYTGRAADAVIRWIVRGGSFGVPDGFVCMSIELAKG